MKKKTNKSFNKQELMKDKKFMNELSNKVNKYKSLKKSRQNDSVDEIIKLLPKDFKNPVIDLAKQMQKIFKSIMK